MGRAERAVRIGIVCPYSLSVPGGVQGQVLALANTLRERGHEARVLAPCDGPPPDSHVTVIGPSVQNPTNGSIAPIAPMPAAQLRTISAMWDERFDVVHLHEPLVPGPCATTLVLKPAPLVGTFHAAGDVPEYRRFKGLARWLGRRLDAKVAVSKAARDMVAFAIEDPWTILFNGIDTDRFAAPAGTDAGRLAVPRSVLFVGRHEERKGLAVLLEALPELPADLGVLVVGDGPQTDELKARFGHDRRVQWLGRVSDAERDRLMATSGVVCAPALGGESFGIVLAEAMAAGTPVVASDIDGYRQVAGDAAVLVPPGDARALARAVTRVLVGSPAERAALVARGRARADDLSMRVLADRYLQIYESVL